MRQSATPRARSGLDMGRLKLNDPAATLKRAQAKAKREALGMLMEQHLKAEKLIYVKELRFHPVRMWRADFAFPTARLLLEVDGATWTGGRHTRGDGYAKDCEKGAEAAALGWRTIHVTADQVKSGLALGWVKRALGYTP